MRRRQAGPDAMPRSSGCRPALSVLQSEIGGSGPHRRGRRCREPPRIRPRQSNVLPAYRPAPRPASPNRSPDLHASPHGSQKDRSPRAGILERCGRGEREALAPLLRGVKNGHIFFPNPIQSYLKSAVSRGFVEGRERSLRLCGRIRPATNCCVDRCRSLPAFIERWRLRAASEFRCKYQ